MIATNGTPVAALLGRLKKLKRVGDGWTAQCPCHDDGTNSLTIDEGDDGRALLHCHAGCATNDVVGRIGLQMSDLMPQNGHAANGKPKIVATYDYRDEAGELLYQVCRFEPKGFRQRKPKDGGGSEWKLGDVRRVLYRLPELRDAIEGAGESPPIVFVVEGEKDCDRLAKLGLTATCNAGGAGKWRQSYSDALAGCCVVAVPDNDKAGCDHAGDVARMTPGARILTLPGLPDKGDVSDWLDAGGTVERLLELVEGAETPVPPAGLLSEETDSRPTIEVTCDEFQVNDQAVDALTVDETLFERGALVTVVRNGADDHGVCRPDGAPRIIALVSAGLRERLAKHARFVKKRETKNGETIDRVHPPEFCSAAILVRGSWPRIRRLNGVVSSPVLKPDGSVLMDAGYDSATGLLHEPSALRFDIPSHPTADQIRQAVESLREVFADFPFAKPEHEATAIAFTLSPAARFAHHGPSPLFLADANTRGSGKTKLLGAGARVNTGRDLAVMANPENDAEARKRITSIAIEADRIVLIDNIGPDGLGCPSLDAALTGTTWKDRILGRNETVEMPLLTTWCGSGNNVALKADTARRIAHIRLESPLENPETRTGFRHPDLLRWVSSERGRLLSAVLTILRGYCAAGRPDQRLPSWGSFEGWSDLVRQAVVWCGLPDPGAAREELRLRSDTEATSLRDLLIGWRDFDVTVTGVTTADVLTELDRERNDYKQLRSAVLELCPAPQGKLPGVRSLGNKLRHLRGRIVGGLFIDSRDSHGVAKWFVSSATSSPDSQNEGGSGCSSCSVANPSRVSETGLDVVVDNRLTAAMQTDQPDPPDPPELPF